VGGGDDIQIRDDSSPALPAPARSSGNAGHPEGSHGSMFDCPATSPEL
jgi:hypothetical protein